MVEMPGIASRLLVWAIEQVDLAGELLEFHFRGFEDARDHPPEADRHDQLDDLTGSEVLLQGVERLLATLDAARDLIRKAQHQLSRSSKQGAFSQSSMASI